jgi:hypothetical protein
VDSDEVAARLVELTLGAPTGRVPDLAGPEVTSWAGLLADYLRACGRRRLVMPILIPGTRAIRAGALLPPPEHSAGNGSSSSPPTGRLHPCAYLTTS